jgi:hypothetical protein
MTETRLLGALLAGEDEPDEGEMGGVVNKAVRSFHAMSTRFPRRGAARRPR